MNNNCLFKSFLIIIVHYFIVLNNTCLFLKCFEEKLFIFSLFLTTNVLFFCIVLKNNCLYFQCFYQKMFYFFCSASNPEQFVFESSVGLATSLVSNREIHSNEWKQKKKLWVLSLFSGKKFYRTFLLVLSF